MPNGTPGDHPFTDIVNHGLDVYSPDIARLVREIDQLAGDKDRRGLGDLLFLEYNVFSNSDVAKLERVLTDMRDKLLADARKRGYEI